MFADRHIFLMRHVQSVIAVLVLVCVRKVHLQFPYPVPYPQPVIAVPPPIQVAIAIPVEVKTTTKATTTTSTTEKMVAIALPVPLPVPMPLPLPPYGYLPRPPLLMVPFPPPRPPPKSKKKITIISASDENDYFYADYKLGTDESLSIDILPDRSSFSISDSFGDRSRELEIVIENEKQRKIKPRWKKRRKGRIPLRKRGRSKKRRRSNRRRGKRGLRHAKRSYRRYKHSAGGPAIRPELSYVNKKGDVKFSAKLTHKEAQQLLNDKKQTDDKKSRLPIGSLLEENDEGLQIPVNTRRKYVYLKSRAKSERLTKGKKEFLFRPAYNKTITNFSLSFQVV